MLQAKQLTIREKLKRFDLLIALPAIFLSLVSILMLWGGIEKFGLAALMTQLIATLLGLGMMLGLSLIDYQEVVDKLWVPFYIIAVGILGLTLVIGTSEGNNQSWIYIFGVSIQPSEFAKAVLILTFSKHLDLVKKNINNLFVAAGLAMHAGLMIGLILLSGDLGVALVYCGIILIMLYCAGLSYFYFLGIAAAVVLAAPMLWEFMSDYQRARIIYGFNPELDPLDYGFQALQGRAAIANGGFFGRGMFGGDIYLTLPVSGSDFAFSTVCEKFGGIVGLLVIVALGVLAVRLFVLARSARMEYGSYICIGIAAAIAVQTFENIGMCLAMLPVVGITLPLVSYGGSSTLAMYIMLGMAQSVRTHKEKYRIRAEE